MPGDVDERGMSAARGLLDSVSSADTAAALAAVRSMTAAPYANDGPSRRGWILVAAAAVVAVAVVGTLMMLDRRSDSVATVDSEPPSSDSATTTATTEAAAGAPSTTVAPETTSPIVTVPRFALDGVWMAGPDVVWALVDGRMVRSLDGGLSWRDAGNPGAFEDSRGAFLNAETGWIIGGEGLMVTRDGGNSWQPVDILPDGFDDDTFTGLAAHGERVYLTMWTVPTVTIWSSPADHDEWTATPTEVSIGSGQIPNSQFAFSASATFLVHDNQGAVGALQLIDGEWTDWPVGCTGGEPSLLTSGDPGDVAIICYPGRFDPRDSPVDGSDLNEGSTYMFSSRDDGATFSEVTPPTAFAPDEFGRLRYIVLAHPDPATFVVTPERSDGTNPIYITHDQGTTWSPFAIALFAAGPFAADVGTHLGPGHGPPRSSRQRVVGLRRCGRDLDTGRPDRDAAGKRADGDRHHHNHRLGPVVHQRELRHSRRDRSRTRRRACIRQRAPASARPHHHRRFRGLRDDHLRLARPERLHRAVHLQRRRLARR